EERLLGKFIVATDQPFTLVEEPEFRVRLQYVHKHTGRVLEIPKAKSVKGKIMKMGDELEKELTGCSQTKTGGPLFLVANISASCRGMFD
ncbi:hypothetical protein B0H14DRAFT_2400862, partial [Mycena olivaceomarginata]